MAIIEISDVADLQAMENDLTADYVIINDIDASDTVNWNGGAGFDPIDDFNGSLDGQGYTVSNLYINRKGAGLLGEINSSVIRNLHLENIDFGTTDKYYNCWVGGLVSRVPYCNLTVSNVSITGTVKNGDYTNNALGGLIGRSTGSNIDIENISIDVEFVGGAHRGAGGLIGYQKNQEGSSITIRNSYAKCTGTISMGGYTERKGGLIGYIELTGGDTDIINSYAVYPDSYGGLVGVTESSFLSAINSFWDSEVGPNNTAGGEGTGKTTAEMKNRSTFTDTSTTGLSESWDMAAEDTYDATKTWGIGSLIGTLINDGYPFLMVFHPHYLITFNETNNIENVSVELRENNSSGSLIDTLFTDSRGEVDIKLANGDYWFEWSKYEWTTDNDSFLVDSSDEIVDFSIKPGTVDILNVDPQSHSATVEFEYVQPS